ncbi:nuclear transport factor 2 family protein [Caballeronia sp. NK8]|uniref:nuclear transport factor 2 family protein n=1 Tax=Caballeronia sp. NK8 TaxID=140098 RepID=UPI001BCDF2B0
MFADAVSLSTNLISAFNRAVDESRFEDASSCFTPTGVFEVDGIRFEGRYEISKYLESVSTSPRASLSYEVNHVFDFENESHLKALTYRLVHACFSGSGTRLQPSLIAIYKCTTTLALLDGRWQFAQRMMITSAARPNSE